MQSDIAISVRNVSKVFRCYSSPHLRLKQILYKRKQFFSEFWSLKNISFDLKKGETVGIVGRNGSGKSTLLQLICNTMFPTEGTIKTHGRIAALLELGSGFNPEFTGRENIFLNSAILGLTQDEVNSKFNDILDFAEIESFIDQPIKTYSTGMQLRLAFAIAINIEPQILIVDEALAVGDELFQRKCFDRIKQIKDNGATILFVSHSAGSIIELCDRAILLDAGEKIAMGTPKRIVAFYQRLLYAPTEQQVKVRNEIIASIENEEIVNPEKKEETQINPNSDFETEEPEYFDPCLKPKSTQYYEPNGAVIEFKGIYTLLGKKVNYLQRGKRYYYRYQVKFYKSAINVSFGMLIKTISGLELGGAVSAPSYETISYVESGSIFHVEFCFLCTLNPALYFLNAGVSGYIDGNNVFLHRILDITTFHVMPIKNNISTGIIDFNCSVAIEPMHAEVKVLN